MKKLLLFQKIVNKKLIKLIIKKPNFKLPKHPKLKKLKAKWNLLQSLINSEKKKINN